MFFQHGIYEYDDDRRNLTQSRDDSWLKHEDDRFHYSIPRFYRHTDERRVLHDELQRRKIAEDEMRRRIMQEKKRQGELDEYYNVQRHHRQATELEQLRRQQKQRYYDQAAYRWRQLEEEEALRRIIHEEEQQRRMSRQPQQQQQKQKRTKEPLTEGRRRLHAAEEDKQDAQHGRHVSGRKVYTMEKRLNDRNHETGSKHEGKSHNEEADFVQSATKLSMECKTLADEMSGQRSRVATKRASKRVTVIVEDASDSEYDDDDENINIWRNRRPSPGLLMEPVNGYE